jgi:hypothetical protein
MPMTKLNVAYHVSIPNLEQYLDNLLKNGSTNLCLLPQHKKVNVLSIFSDDSVGFYIF